MILRKTTSALKVYIRVFLSLLKTTKHTQQGPLQYLAVCGKLSKYFLKKRGDRSGGRPRSSSSLLCRSTNHDDIHEHPRLSSGAIS
jgi:hypothetical protein